MKESLLRYFASRHLLVNVIALVVVAGGVFTWLNTGKEELPDITFDTVRIAVSYPGASPADQPSGTTHSNAGIAGATTDGTLTTAIAPPSTAAAGRRTARSAPGHRRGCAPTGRGECPPLSALD